MVNLLSKLRHRRITLMSGELRIVAEFPQADWLAYGRSSPLREEVEVGEWKAPLMALGLAGAGSGLKPDGQDGAGAP